jgi:hypothetical protein
MDQRIYFFMMILLSHIFVNSSQQSASSLTGWHSVRLDSSFGGNATQSSGVNSGQSSTASSYYQKMVNTVKPVGSFVSRQAKNVSSAVQPGIDFMGRQASTLGSSVKSAYQAAPNIGLEIGLQKAGSVVKSGVTKVSSAASAAYNKVVSTELGYQAKLLVSPQERRQVAEYQKEGIKDLSLSLFGDHEGPGDILNLHQERQKTEALSRELQKEGLSKPAVKSYIDNKQNIRSKTDKNNEGIENLRKESEKINSELDTEILSIRLNNKSVDFRYLERDRLRVMQIEDPVEQNRAFKELQQKISAKKNGSLDVGMEKYEIIDGEIHDRGEWV